MAMWRKMPTSYFGDPRVEGLPPLAHVLLQQCRLANIAGLLERSPNRMAAIAGGSKHGVLVSTVWAAIKELKARGLVEYWEDLDVLLYLDVAGIECSSEKTRRGALSVVERYPEKVRSAFAKQYRWAPQHWCTFEEEFYPPGAPHPVQLMPSHLNMTAQAIIAKLSEARMAFMAEEESAARRNKVSRLALSGERGLQTDLGVVEAVNEHGLDTVLEVYKHSMKLAADGEISGGMLACMFCGNGFGHHFARYAEYLEKLDAAEKVAEEMAKAEAEEKMREENAIDADDIAAVLEATSFIIGGGR